MKKTSLVLGFMLILLLAVSSGLMAATIYANSSTGNDTTGDGSEGSPYKTFHKAYTEAISGDTIDLTGTFTWTDADETGDNATTGYTINKDLTIQGQGAGVTYVQAAETAYTADRCVIYIASSRNVTIQDLTIRYGFMIQGGDYNAAGVHAYFPACVTILSCEITENANCGRYGECGIYSRGGDFIMRNSTVHTNNGYTAQAATGASWPGYLGGLRVDHSGVKEVTNCTFYGNSASYNGAIYCDGSTIELIVTNSTFINNRGSVTSSDICAWQGTVYLKNNIFADKAGTYSLTKNAGTFVDGGYNIIETEDNTGFTNGVNGNLVGEQSSLNISSTLEDNNTLTGTQTLALSSGSVAINAGDSDAHGPEGNQITPPTTDQRGATRNGTVDIGAYEWWSDDGALPVTLSSFTARVERGTVILEWVTGSEIENLGFLLERASTSLSTPETHPEWKEIANYIDNPELQGQGSVTGRTEYQFVDNSVEVGKTYDYRLADVSYSGVVEYHSLTVMGVELTGLPTEFALLPAYPNPFNPATTILYTLIEDGNVTLTIFDINGREVVRLVEETQTAGAYDLTWDARGISSGVYFYKLVQGDKVSTRKLIYLK